MQKKVKKVLVVMLCFTMLFSAMPFSAFAEDNIKTPEPEVIGKVEEIVDEANSEEEVVPYDAEAPPEEESSEATTSKEDTEAALKNEAEETSAKADVSAPSSESEGSPSDDVENPVEEEKGINKENEESTIEVEQPSEEQEEEPVEEIKEEIPEEVASEEHKEEVEPSENAQPTKEEIEKQAQEAKEKAEAEAKLKAEEEERARIEAEEEAIKTLDGMNFSSKRLIVEADAKTVEGEPVVGSYENTYLIQYETERDAKLGYLRMKDSASIIEIDREDTFVVSDDLELAPYEEPEQTPLKDEAEESNPIAEIENASSEIVKRYDVAVIDTGANTVDAVSVLGDDGRDSNGHGQAMVDTIKEIAPNAKVLSIKAIGGNGKGDTSAVYAAIKLAIENNVKIINLSIAAPAIEENAIIESVINEAIDKGITVVGAAGNHGRNAGLFLPGKVERAVIVGVCDKEGNILKSFNYGNTVDYYVEAKSTSYAAATVTGLILRDGLDSLKQYANNAIVNEAEEEELGTTPEERRRIFSLLTGGFGIQASDVSWLTAIRNEKIYYDDYGLNENGRCSVVTAKLSNGKTTTLCCVETNIVNGSFDFTYTDIREVTNQRLRKAAFYGNIFGKNDDKERTYGSNYRNVALEIVMGLGANADTSGASNYQEERAYLITHHATSKIVIDAGLNNHPDADWDWNANSSLQSDVNRFISIIDGLAAPPEGYRVYLAAPDDYDTQLYLFDDMEPAPAKVDLIIKKVSYNQGQKVITDLDPSAFAVFKVQHLDTSGAVTRTWHFKTRTALEAEAAGQPETAGVANLQNGNYLYNALPNDPLYVMDGKVYFPEGTIVVEEIITPEGYFPAEAIKLTAVSRNVDGSFVASWSNWTKEQTYVTYRGIKKVRADGLRHDIVDVDNYSLTTQTNLQIKKYKIDPVTGEKKYLTLEEAKGVVFEMKVFPTDPTLDKRIFFDTVYENQDGEVVINFAHRNSIVTNDKNYESDKFYKSQPNRTGLPLGRVEIRELKAPPGFEKFEGVLKATIYEKTEGGKVVLDVDWDDETKALPGVQYDGKKPVVIGHSINAETISLLEPQDGYAKLIKTSTNTSITKNNDCYNMTGIKYNVYKTNTGDQYNPVLSGKVGELEITEYNKATSTGKSNTIKLEIGTYWVQEVKATTAGTGFLYDSKAYKVTVTNQNSDSNPAKVNVSDVPFGDPIDVALTKVNDLFSDNHVYTDEEKAVASLAGAEFTVKYYDGMYTTVASAEASGNPTTTWVFKTDAGGEIILSENAARYLVSGSLYYDQFDQVIWPKGTYVFQETKAPTNNKFNINDAKFVVTQDLNEQTGKTSIKIYKADGTIIESETIDVTQELVDIPLKIKEVNKRGGVKVGKVDSVNKTATPQGKATFAGAEFTIYANEKILKGENEFWQKDDPVMTITTGSDGTATTANNALLYGNYYVKETKAPTGYKLNTTYKVNFQIREDKVIVDTTNKNHKVTASTAANAKSGWTTATGSITPEDATNKEDVITGGVKIEKWDKDLQKKVAQGDADFSGIKFEITNKSGKAVWVDGTKYDNNAVIANTVLITNAAGDAQTTNNRLPYGDYQIKEVATNGSYLLTSGTARDFEIRIDGKYVETSNTENSLSFLKPFINKVVEGLAKIIKKAKETETAQGDADLAGIRYAIVNRSAKSVYVDGSERAKGEVVQIVSTNTNGEVTSARLPYGTYDVYELKADATIVAGDTYDNSTKLGSSIYANGTGYLFKEKRERVVVRTENETYSTNFVNDIVRGGINIAKIDKETAEDSPQGWARFEDAEFTIYNNSKKAVWVEGTKYEVGAAVKTVKTNEEGIASVGKILPYGTYYVKETKAPEGYLLNTEWRLDFQIREEGKIIDGTKDEVVTVKTGLDAKTGITVKTGTLTANEPEDPEAIIRADLKFFKVNIDGAKQAYIPFLVQRLDREGKIVESHVIISDKDGWVDTSNITARPKTETNVNVLDDFVENGVYSGPLNDEAAGRNIWFGEKTAVANDRGSLIYARYKVTELQSTNNDAEDILTQEVFDHTKIKELFTNNKVFELDNIFVNLIIHPESTLIDNSSMTKVMTCTDNAPVTDSVRWDHLKIGQEYELETVIKYLDREGGGEVELGRNSVTFTPDKVDKTNTSYGITDNTIILDMSEYAGKGGTVNAVDYIYALRDGNRILIATHNNELNIKSQTVVVPYMETHASDTRTFDHVGTPVVDAGIIDKVYYENLPEGKMFILKEKIVDRDNPEDVIGEAERIISVSSQVTAPKEGLGGILSIPPDQGEITMPEITFDASEFDGKTLVVYETLINYYTDEVFLAHEELSDEEQSIHYIKVGTVATDEATGTHTGAVVEEDKVIDEVKIENCIPGMEYTVTGKFMRKDTMEVVAESEPVTITAENETEYVYIEFMLDTRELEGVSCVAYEYVSHNDVEVGKHEDPDDEGQIINYPKVRTMAVDGDTKTHTGVVGEVATIVDTVSLRNLTVGDTYKVIGSLHFKDGTPVTVKKTLDDETVVEEAITMESDVFTADVEDTEKTITFTLSTLDLKGKDVVVYEKLIHIGEKDVVDEEGNPTGETEPNETEVARHEDPTDEGQTVNIPDGRTNAFDSKTLDQVGTVGETEVITDKVTYRNLVPGDEYRIEGKLYYREDFTDKNGVFHAKGDIVKDLEGNEITSDKTFRPETENGFELVTFEVDSTLLEGAVIVVGETFYVDKVKVYAHFDLEDEPQTVYYPKVRTTLISQLTGDHVGDTNETTVMVDTVKLTNLLVGEEYTVRGVLMDKKTKEPVPGVTTEPVTFTAEESDMEIEITFTLSGKERENRTTVAFEELIHNNVVVASHKDIGDGNQTVWTPSVITEAKDEETDANVGRPREETVIVDKITLNNLIKGREYTVTGYLMDQSTGEKYIDADGNEVAGEPITFTATKSTEVKEMTFKFNGSNLKGKTVTVFEDLYHNEVLVAAHRDINSVPQSVDYPDGRTTAKDAKTNTKMVLAEKEATVIDTMHCTNLRPGLTYTVNGTLMVKETGEPLMENGKPVTGTTTFTPDAKDVDVEIEFKFDASLLKGQKLVAFETVLYNDIEVIVHHDIDDEEQTVTVPEIGTLALDKSDEDHIVTAKKNVVVDTVEYKGLTPSTKFMLRAQIYDKTDEKLLEEVYEKEFTSSASGEGTVEISIPVDGKALEGHVLVMYEEVMFVPEDKPEEPKGPVAEHKDPKDEDQTIYVPKIRTLAKDVEDGDHFIMPEENQTIVDTVMYEGLIPNSDYIMKLTVYDKTVGELTDIPEVVKEFKSSETGKGEVEVEVTVDGTIYAGHVLVMFEECVTKPNTPDEPERPVGEHKNPKDEDQTIYVPEIGTNATDKADGDNIIYNVGKNTIVDTISYKGLKPGTYWTTLTVMDKNTGKPLEIDGAPVTKTEKVTITKSEGTFDVEVEIFADRTKGKTLVMFEEMRLDGNIVAEHKDIKDEDQTIYAPEIGTKLTVNGKKEVEPSKETTLVDTVSYSNLIPGKTYTMSGELVNKSTKEVVAKAEAKFVASETGSGKVEITFKADTTKLAGKSVVAFETCTYEENGTVYKVAEHKDINDKDQTVKVKNPAPYTGDDTNVLPYIGLFAIALLSAIVISRKRTNK